jgi:hypothetical protein
MLDIESLASQIKKNCNISDAKYWGYYSLCGLLFRLREMYRAENRMKLWEKIPQKDVGEWIDQRENTWKEFEEKDFEDIAVNGNIYSPFDVEQINSELEKEGLVYGAGIGLRMKPSFFLADLISKEKHGGVDIYVAGDEYARDLSDYPAMLQDGVIFARTDPIRLLLWQKFEEMRCKSTKCALAFAFSKYDIFPEEEPSEKVFWKISRVARSEAETFIHHELGEAFEGEKIGDEWKALLVCLGQSKAELFARAVKDILSDTSENGMLKYIIRTRKEGSLGFYIVFLSGVRKVIFPEILDAFRTFSGSGDWESIDIARGKGHKKAREYAERLLSLYRKKKDDASLTESIDKEMLSGLL